MISANQDVNINSNITYKDKITHFESDTLYDTASHEKKIESYSISMETVIVDNNSMPNEKSLDKKVKEYGQDLLTKFKISKYASIKKSARALFTNTLHITRSYLIKFIKYYVSRSKYSYMSSDPRFKQKQIIDDLLKQLPTKKAMDRLEAYDHIAEYFMNKSSIHPVFSDISQQITVHKIHKITSPSIKNTVDKMYHNYNEHGKLHPLISDEYYEIVMKHHRKIQNKIVSSRDYLFDSFGMKTLLRSYLFRYRRKDGDKILERPQHLIMRVAIGIHGYDLDAAFETYEYMSQRYFTHATPTLFNAGTKRAQMSSCFLMGVGDNIESIFGGLLSDIAYISKWSGGIGVHLGKIRAAGSIIEGTNGKSDGIIPLCQTINSIARYINQGGKRNGSVAAYLPAWHGDIFEFVELRSVRGNETLRARDLFLALWLSDLFMKRVSNNEMWSLMCPNSCKGLNEVYGKEFEDLYTSYEEKGMYIRQVRATDLFKHIMTMQIESGFPYITYKDACNRKSNQKNLGCIKSSNLCSEIIEFSDENETAVCNLCSVCLPMFCETRADGTKYFNHDMLGKITRICVRNLNKVINRNYYPTPKTKLSNMKHRPVGIGVQGLADLYNMMGYPYDSDDAKKLNKQIFETMYYHSLDESKICAVKHGRPYESFPGSPASKGILQYHMWGLKEEDLSMGYDWKTLIKDIKEHGIRNSLLIALMPTASTSQIMGNSECTEPYMSNIFVRTTLAGSFIVVNKNLVMDLDKLGLWTEDMRKKLLIHNGSVQKIKEIPSHLREVYKTAFEISSKAVIDQAYQRGPFICQSQSMNLFIAKPNFDMLYNTLFYGWRRGLKTGMYYYRTTPAVNPIKFGIDIDDVKRLTNDDTVIEKYKETKLLIDREDIKAETDSILNSIKSKQDDVILPREIEECLVCGS